MENLNKGQEGELADTCPICGGEFPLISENGYAVFATHRMAYDDQPECWEER